MEVQSGEEVTFHLRWDGPWGGANKNMGIEIYRYDEDLEWVTDSNQSYFNRQNGESGDNSFDSLRFRATSSEDYCVRVEFPSGLSGSNRPDWVQLGIFNSSLSPDIPKLEYHTQDPENHDEGASLGGYGEQKNDGIMAVGAARYTTPGTIKDYSSRGPAPEHTDTKPDIVGATESHTVTSGNGGTSQAAPHVAGLAALVMWKHDEAGASYDPAAIAKYLEDHAELPSLPSNVSSQSHANTWGHGFAKLPCPSRHLSVPTGTLWNLYYRNGAWNSSDCKSHILPSNYADYYSFTLAQRTNISIDLQSTASPRVRTYLQLIAGISPVGTNLATENRKKAGAVNNISMWKKARTR